MEQKYFSVSREEPDETVIPYEQPTQQQVRDYCRKHGFSTDPNRFFRINYFNDWKVDGKPIRDWRAMLRGWAKYDSDASKPGGTSDSLQR